MALAAGDLDGDGRLDLVATSWGRNTATQVDSTRPLSLVHGPVGAAGEEEMLLAQQDSRIGGLAPLDRFAARAHRDAQRREPHPHLRRVRGRDGEQVLGADSSRAQTLRVTTLDHMVFLNRGDHFEVRALPSEVAARAGVLRGRRRLRRRRQSKTCSSIRIFL